MGKDGGWKGYFHDNRRCADLINGIGCNGDEVYEFERVGEVKGLYN